MGKKLFNFIYQKRGQIIAFVFTMCITLFTLLPQKDMLLGGGDVSDIWKTISSFYSSNVEPSYVLYKGFLSIYPYVWLVKLSQLIGMGDWFLLKIFHSVLFSSIVAIGVPYILSNLLKIDIKLWRRLLFCGLGFILWKSTGIIQTIMIDLPSLFFFIFSACAALKIANNYKTVCKFYFFYAGLMFGCASLYTGQYKPSIAVLILFVIISMFYKKIRENKGRIISMILCLFLLCTGYSIPKAYNVHFENTFVQQFKDQGVNIMDSEDWTKTGLAQAKRRYTMFWGPTIINQRSLSIIAEDKGENYDDFIKFMDAGGGYSTIELVKLIIKHPVDFITSWCNGFLLTVSMNGNSNRISFLLISYTSLFASLFILFKRWKTFRGVFVKETLFIIAFVIPSLVTCVFHFEPRYVIAMQSLFLGAAIYDDTFWNIFKQAFNLIKECASQKSLRPMVDKFNHARFPYVFVLYCIFVVMCFTNYAAIYETYGADPSILFKW